VTEDVRLILTDYLSKHYGLLKRQLGRALRNTTLAEDALHDTWVRIQEQDKQDQAPIQRPGGYLVRMAFNIALDIQRRQGRNLSFDEINDLMELADSAPEPAQTVEMRSELDAMVKLLERMPKRRREVVFLVHMEGMKQPQVAEQLGVSLRTVEYELKHAHDYLRSKMADDTVLRDKK
jgi:RNA polymerase sigma factor (sigma-70 family)